MIKYELVNPSELANELTMIADTIRIKNNSDEPLRFPLGFINAINALSGGGITPTGTKEISVTENGTVTEDVTQYANVEVDVNVPQTGITPTGTKEISVTENGTITEDVTQYASVEVDVNVPQTGITPTGTKQISVTQNGTITEDITNYASVEVSANIPNSIIEKTVLFKNGTSGSKSFGYCSFKSEYNSLFITSGQSLSSDSTLETTLATLDGVNVIVLINSSGLTFTYNNTPITINNISAYSTYTGYHFELPVNYDPTIPIIFS